MGDICVRSALGHSNRRDQQSNHYIVHHNLGALCWGIATANRIFDAEYVTEHHTIGKPIAATAWAMEKVISTGTMEALDRHADVLGGQLTDTPTDSGDDARIVV